VSLFPSASLRTQIGLLVAAVVLIYANSLVNGFTMDDELYIPHNPQVTQHSLHLLVQPNAASNVFRPLTFATFAVNWMAAGYKPFGYHLLNLLLHAAVVVLLLLLLRELLAESPHYESVCFAAALLFAVHPVHTEAVSSVVGRSELLAAGFLLAAWWFHVRDRYVLACLSFALALLSKESAIGLLPLGLAGDYARGKLKSWTRYAALAAITLLYVAALWKIQGGRFGASVSFLDNPLTILPTHLQVLNALRIAWKYVALLAFPATLSCDYSYSQIALYADWRHLLFPAVAALAVFVAWFWATWTGKAVWIIAGTIYFAGFAATSNILTRIGTIFAERLVYLPSTGFCLIAAVLWSKWFARSRQLALVLLCLIAVLLGVRTVIRNRDWRDNGTLYTAAADAVPNSAKMRAFRGIVYISLNRLELARADLQAALRINPEYPDAIEAMGLLEERAGNTTAALPYLQKAIEISDRHDLDYDYRAVNLAILDIQMDRLDDAMKLLNSEIVQAPNYSRAWSNRAALRLRLGQSLAARQDAQMALRLDPTNVQATHVLQSSSPAPLR